MPATSLIPLPDMVAHIYATIRHFRLPDRAEIALEMIDKTLRRGAIDESTAARLRDVFCDTATA